MSLGNRGFVGIKKEVTWKTRVDGDNDVYLPFVSEGLTRDIEDVISAIQRGILDEPKSYQGEKAFGGPLVVEVHPLSIGHILRSALGAPSDGGVASSTETKICDCEAEWTSHTSTITSRDPTDKKKGLYSVKIQVPAGVTDETLLGYFDFPADIDMHEVTAFKFWIKTSIALVNAADLEFLVSESVACGGAPKVINVGTLTINTWTEVTITATDMGSGGGLDWDAVKSLGLKLGADLAEFTIRIDDIRMVVAGNADKAYKHIFTPMQTLAEEFGGGSKDTPLWPYTFEVFRDEGQSYQFLGCVVNTMGLSFSTTDKILKANLGIIAGNAGYVDKTGNALEVTSPFVWKDAKIYLGGVTEPTHRYNDLESFALNWDNKCIAKYALNNTATPRKIIRTGYREIPISFTVDFTDKTEYDYFLSGEERQMRILFTGAKITGDVAETPFSLQFDIPKLRYLAWPVGMGGPGRMSVAVTGKAKFDSTYALLVTSIDDEEHTEYAG